MSGITFWQAHLAQCLMTLEAGLCFGNLWACEPVMRQGFFENMSIPVLITLFDSLITQICLFFPPKRSRRICPQSFLWENMEMSPITELQSVRHPKIATCTTWSPFKITSKIIKPLNAVKKRQNDQNSKTSKNLKITIKIRIFNTYFYGNLRGFYAFLRVGQFTGVHLRAW